VRRYVVGLEGGGRGRQRRRKVAHCFLVRERMQWGKRKGALGSGQAEGGGGETRDVRGGGRVLRVVQKERARGSGGT
jgi:hypothetical protein